MKMIKSLCVLLALLPVCGMSQSYPVTFFVRDAETKDPIGGATIRIEEIRFVTQSTLNDGKSVFQKVPRGKIHFEVVKPGYIPLENESANVIGDDKADAIRVSLLKLPPPAVITIFGKVRNQKLGGLNAPDVPVRIIVGGHSWKAVTDEAGNYAIEIPQKDLKEQVFTIEVAPPGCPPVLKEQELPKDNVTRTDLEICADDAGLRVIQEEISANFSELAALVGSIEMAAPGDVLMRMPGETEKEFQIRAKTFRMSERDLVKQAFDKFKISEETFKAHQLKIREEQVLINIRNVYQKQKETVEAAFGYVEQLNHLLSLDRPDNVFLREALCKQREKVLDAKINLVDAAGLYCWTLDDSLSIDIIKLYLQLAQVRLKGTDSKSIYQETRLLIGSYYQQKAESIAKCAGLEYTPLPPGTNVTIDSVSKIIDSSLTVPPLSRTYEVPIDSSIRDPEKLLSSGTMAYLSGDTRATRYYYQIGLQNDTVAEHFKRYFALSIERMDEPDIYGGALGMMVLKLTPKNGLDKAGIRRFDVITTINGKIINEPKEISDELMQRSKQDSLIEYWRDGQKKSAVIKAGQQGGAVLVPLIDCEPFQI